MKITIFFAIFVLILFANSAYSQSITDETIKSKNALSSEIDLYIPEHMIIGSKYQGMLTYLGHGERTILGVIAANQDAVSVQNSITILPYEDHALFEIIPKHAGVFHISVKADGTTIQKSTTIYESTKNKSLLLVLPERTHTEKIIGAVYLVDKVNNPVFAQDTITVSLTGSSGIVLPDTVTISEGSTGATFQIYAASSGTVSASSGAMYDKVNIAVESKKLRLLMDVYPKIMQENSFGYYFLWFQDDEGNPHIPNDLTVASIHSSEKDIARMELKITGDATSQTKNTFSDGVTYGRIFTGIPGHATVTATIPGYQSATSEFIVGPASFGVSTIQNSTVVDSPAPLRTDRDDPMTANEIKFGVIPPVTVSEGYIIAGLYHSITKESIKIDADNIETSKETIDLYPVFADSRKVYISSDGASHDSIEVLDTANIPTHVNLYEITGTPGEYQVDVSSPQVVSQKPEKFVITGNSAETHHIKIVPLPAIAEHIQDLAMIYVVDSQGAVVDPKSVFGKGVRIHLESQSVFLSSNFVNLNESVEMISGAYTKGALYEAEITAYGDGLEKVSHKVGISSTDSDSVIIINAPKQVHSQEFFAATAHLVRDSKVVSHITDMIDAKGGCQKKDIGIFSCSSQGTLSVFSDIGAEQIQVNPYLNPLAASFQYSFFEKIISVGKNYTVSVSAPDGTVISADTAINHTINDNTITFTPDTVGNFEITITASRSGMSSHSESVTVTVNDLVNLAILARDSEGIPIGVDATVITSTTEVNHQSMTDYQMDIPRNSVTVEFPQSARHGDSGYKLFSISLNNDTKNSIQYHHSNAITFLPDHDSSVTAVYQKVILVDVIGGEGGGVYQVGDTVTVSALPKYTMSFLVQEVLDYWDGIDSSKDTAKFIATKDLSITPIYKTDYTGAVAVFCVMGAIIMVASFGQNSSYRLRISQIVDFVCCTIKTVYTGIITRKARTKKIKDKKQES